MNRDERIIRRMNREKFWTRMKVAFLIIVLAELFIIAILMIDREKTEAMAYMTSLPDLPSVENQIADLGKMVTAEERDLIERVVSAEARGESLQGQMAVAEVIKNRSVLWNRPIEDVLTAEAQFSDPYQGNVSDITKEAVARVFDGNERVLDFNATHFYSGPEPYWADTKPCRGMIGGHTFVGEK